MRLLLLFLITLVLIIDSKNVFVSSPFDNFRIECPKRAAATELTIRMVESVGQKRQDVVFDLSCETVEDLYPWLNIPVGILDIEREDCRYSDMMDPILDENTTYTCGPREYLAGITRLSDTRVQSMCCKLRSRDEFNCKEMVFNKPIGLTRSSVIENDNQLINAVRVQDRNYVVRFCDLAPRETGAILMDEKIKPSTTRAPSSAATHKPDPLKFQKTVKIIEVRQNSFPLPPRLDTSEKALPDVAVPLIVFNESKQMIDITTAEKSLPSLSVKQRAKVPLTLVTLSPIVTTSEETPIELEIPVPTTRTPVLEESTISQETPSFDQQLVEDIVRKIGKAQSEQKAAQIFQQSLNKLLQNANEKTIAFQQNDPSTALPESSELELLQQETNQQFSNVLNKQRFSKELLPLRRNMDVDDFASLQPVNVEGRRRSPIRTHRPHVDIWSSEDDEDDLFAKTNNQETKITTTTTATTTTAASTSLEAPKQKNNRKKTIRKIVRGHRLENESEIPTTTITDSTHSKKYRNSFFGSIENVEPKNRVHYDENQESRRFRVWTTTPSARRDLPVTRKYIEQVARQPDNARDIDEDTRLSPFDDPSLITQMKNHEKNQQIAPRVEFQEDEDIEEVISKLSARQSDIRRSPVRNSFAEAQFSDKLSPPETDAVKSYTPRNGIPIKIPQMESMPMSSSSFDDFDLISNTHVDDENNKTPNEELNGQYTNNIRAENEHKNREDIELITFPIRPTTTSYDPANFYRTPRPKPAKKETILRFCSKESALRDQSNMVIACGLDQDIWTPNRCPENTDCFPSHDSFYRICCPVHHG